VPQKRKRTYYLNDLLLGNIGKKIRELRLVKGLTQMELAFNCGDLDYSQINRIELGNVNFSVSYLLLFKEALEVEPNELFIFKDKKNSKAHFTARECYTKPTVKKR
jgi:transcriptional regulator with XRE-family HTH domain